MFGKKYVFETKATKNRRLIINTLIASFLTLSSLTLFCLFIPYFAKNQSDLSDKLLYQKSPDMIAVFTGGAKRLEHTFKLSEKHPSSRIHISGVYAKNSLKTLLYKQKSGLSVDDYLAKESHHIELDYLAKNTLENVLGTIRSLETHPENKSALIISSDYHIFRIKMIVDKIATQTPYQFYYHGISTDYTKWYNLKILFVEVYKTIRTFFFLLFWG